MVTSLKIKSICGSIDTSHSALSANAGTCVITYDPWWLNFKTSYLFFFNIFISDKKWHLPLEKSFTDNLMNNLATEYFILNYDITDVLYV